MRFFGIMRLPGRHALRLRPPLEECGLPGRHFRLRPPLEDEGEIYLYLQPYPQEAERLRFSIEGISAVSADGREFPFEISLREIKASDVRRQRLLASGRVPAGLLCRVII